MLWRVVGHVSESDTIKLPQKRLTTEPLLYKNWQLALQFLSSPHQSPNFVFSFNSHKSPVIMIFTGLLSLATLLPALVVAEDLEVSDAASVNKTGPITLVASLYEEFDENSFYGAEIKVYNNGLYINTDDTVKTKTFCPTSAHNIDCSQLNSPFAWFEVETREPRVPAALKLAVKYPAGQSLFVNQTSGAIGFLRAGSEYPLRGASPIVPLVSIPGGEGLSLLNEYLVNPAHEEFNNFYFCATSDKKQFTVNAFKPTTGVCKQGYIQYRFTYGGEKSGAWIYV